MYRERDILCDDTSNYTLNHIIIFLVLYVNISLVMIKHINI